jgi:hypothetical protein
MKRISIGFFVIFLVSLIFSACQENVYMDWKLANQRFYNTLEDSMKYYASTAYTSLPDSIKKTIPPMTRDTDKTTGISYYYKLYYGGYPLERKPNAGSMILVTYNGTLINNYVFDQATSPAAFTLAKTIPAWRDIMPKLHSGAHLKLYVPSTLGYDTATTTLPKIPPHSVLIFDINLIDSQY